MTRNFAAQKKFIDQLAEELIWRANVSSNHIICSLLGYPQVGTVKQAICLWIVDHHFERLDSEQIAEKLKDKLLTELTCRVLDQNQD